MYDILRRIVTQLKEIDAVTIKQHQLTGVVDLPQNWWEDNKIDLSFVNKPNPEFFQ